MLATLACKKNDAEQALGQEGETFTVELSGSFEQPELVNLEVEQEIEPKLEGNTLRNFVLRAEDIDSYPKIAFTGIEAGEAFEPFVSAVWLYPQDRNNNDENRIMIVEDNLDPKVRVTKTQAGQYNSGTPTRGISRVIKENNKYRFLIGYNFKQSDTNRNGANRLQPVVTYRQGVDYRFVAAVNPSLGTPERTSKHRGYYPYYKGEPKDFIASNATVTMDALKLVPTGEDYLVSAKGNNMALNQRDSGKATLPLFSKFGQETTSLKGNHAGVETSFHMAGALLALKLRNDTGEPIIVKNIRTKSNDIAYYGYYEFWYSHHLFSNNSAYNTPEPVPFFARGDVTDQRNNALNAIYIYPLQGNTGQALPELANGASTAGRFYLWGGIDRLTTRDFKTYIQVEYSYASNPQQTIYAETVEVTPKNAPRRFENGKAYLITIPVRRPTVGNLDFTMPEHFGGDLAKEDFPNP